MPQDASRVMAITCQHSASASRAFLVSWRMLAILHAVTAACTELPSVASVALRLLKRAAATTNITTPLSKYACASTEATTLLSTTMQQHSIGLQWIARGRSATFAQWMSLVRVV